MGGGIAQKLLTEHEVIVWNRSQDIVHEFISVNPNSVVANGIEELTKKLDSPKIIWIMVPHAAVEEILNSVKKFVSPGDVVIDGGNSNYKDTQRRFEEFKKEGIHFLGIGVSGGILARENGYSLMVGGSKEGFDIIKPILETLSKPNGGYEYLGSGGAGHFVKMIHNGIEYGMMQSIGEGFEILEKSDYGLDLSKVASVWKKGTIISGLLIDLVSKQLDKQPGLESFEGVVSRSGEGDWTLEAAGEEGVNVPAIEASVYFRQDTETEPDLQKSFTAKVLNALRAAFGGHSIRQAQAKKL